MVEKFQRKVLKNGMVVIFEKRSVPVVSVAIAVRNGGINEDLHEKGISHFIEHMLYKGTPTRSSRQIAKEIERNGGVLNGFTDESITAYWCKMPSSKLNIALDVLSDMVKNPKFDEKEMEKERKVIFEEIKMRKDRPEIYVNDKIQNFLYKGTLSQDLIGNEKTLHKITREKMMEKFKQVYTPNNMILCVVGAGDFKSIVKFAEKNFGNQKGKVPQFDVSFRNESKTEKRKGVDQVNLVLGYHAPLFNDRKSYAAKVLSALMSEGMSSRLFSEIREKRNLAYSVHGLTTAEKKFAHNVIYVGTSRDNVDKVKELIIKEFVKVSDELTQEEIEEVKNQIVGNYYISMENSQSQLFHLLYFEVNGDVDKFYDFEKNIRGVKLADVKVLAKKAAKDHSFFALVPE